MATRRQDYDYLIKLLLIGDSGKAFAQAQVTEFLQKSPA